MQHFILVYTDCKSTCECHKKVRNIVISCSAILKQNMMSKFHSNPILVLTDDLQLYNYLSEIKYVYDHRL